MHMEKNPWSYHQSKPHRIKALKMIPRDDTIFVVREVDLPRTPTQRCPAYLFETYIGTPAGANPLTEQRVAQARIIDTAIGHLAHVYIADPNNPIRDDDSLLGNLDKAHDADTPPPPLVVLGHTTSPEGVLCIRMPAERIVMHLPPTPPSAGTPRIHAPEQTRVTYRYTLHSYLRFGSEIDANRNVRILPSLRRPLLCFTPWDDITDAPLVERIAPLIDAGPPAERQVDETGRAVPPLVCKFKGTPDRLGKHASAFAWDETIGRLVLAEKDTEVLRVYDFAHEPKLGEGCSRELILSVRTDEDNA
ncbi:hypothetical protein PYCCODRAFT_1270011 [Trametes coccinea BRFM310]|uniref:Uncharacterized protein n=1 Tax=Trametes coccinea (strain BRFM310) TaxID=1353009 RepID=A0A1Y2IV01_TRAC3|nr:hypothetical protein PYCCODRAFT_1270011 [Trametes coccinea BRFM310]